MIAAIVVLLALAAVAGVAYQRRMRRSHADGALHADAEGIPGPELLNPVRTLAALLLAFVLLSVYTSFEAADDDAGREAGAVLAMAEDALLLPDADRDRVLAALRCYTRAVIGPDWAAQDDGRASPVADQASVRIGEAVSAVRGPRAAVAASAVLTDDSMRIQARIGRIHEGRPSVPLIVTLLLVATVAVAVGATAALAHPAVRARVHLGVLVGTTVVFGLALVVVHDLDRPYGGLAKIEPDAMQDVQRQIEGLPGGLAVEPACDADGAEA